MVLVKFLPRLVPRSGTGPALQNQESFLSGLIEIQDFQIPEFGMQEQRDLVSSYG